MRTSVSFRRKVENVLLAPADKPQYGDAVYINAALKDWTKGIVSVLATNHPTFPAKDYDDLYYVVTVRQAEIGMNKRDGGGWFPPLPIVYKLAA